LGAKARGAVGRNGVKGNSIGREEGAQGVLHAGGITPTLGLVDSQGTIDELYDARRKAGQMGGNGWGNLRRSRFHHLPR
jgi:hypothetical protein